MTVGEYRDKMERLEGYLRHPFGQSEPFDLCTDDWWRLAAREALDRLGMTPLMPIPAADGGHWIKVPDRPDSEDGEPDEDAQAASAVG